MSWNMKMMPRKVSPYRSHNHIARRRLIHLIIYICELYYWNYTCRATCSFIYYALTLNIGALSGDIFINTFISGAVEVPANLLCIVASGWPRVGRRLTGCLSMTGAGLFSFLCIPCIIQGKLASYVEVTTFFCCWYFSFLAIVVLSFYQYLK